MHFAFPLGTNVYGVSAAHVYYRLESWVYRMELETLKVQRLCGGSDYMYGVRICANGDAVVELGGCEYYYAPDGTQLSGLRTREFARWTKNHDYFVRWTERNGYTLHKKTSRTRERLRYLVRDDAMRRRLETFL